MINVMFEWDPARRFGCDEMLPPLTEMPHIPQLGSEIESGAFGNNWQVTRVCYVYNDIPKDCHFIIFVV